jgi:hypothetical protein
MQAKADTASGYWQGSSFSSSQEYAIQLNSEGVFRSSSRRFYSLFISSGPNPRFFLLVFTHATGTFLTVSPSMYPNPPFLKVFGSGIASSCASSANGGSRLVCGCFGGAISFGMACLVSLLAYAVSEVNDLVIAALPCDFSAIEESSLASSCFGGGTWTGSDLHFIVGGGTCDGGSGDRGGTNPSESESGYQCCWRRRPKQTQHNDKTSSKPRQIPIMMPPTCSRRRPVSEVVDGVFDLC